MKYLKLLSILMLSSVISFYACKDKTSEQKQAEPTPLKVSNSSTDNKTSTPDPITSENTQNTASAFHYTCSNGCAGGAASAVNCTTCGTLLVHNQAFHSNTNSNTNDPNVATPFLTPPAAEAGKNTAGVFHYTCGNGCAGGAASAGNCASCGEALAHNAAYHN